MIPLSRQQPTLFDSERMDFEQALEMTETSLRAYALNYKHWAIAYSGGKDSSCVLTATIHLIETGRVPRPETLTVFNSDTRMELPPLQAAAMQMLEEVRRRGFDARVVHPTLDDTILTNPRWHYLMPLKELKPFYREVKKANYRIRKDGTEKRKDGKLVKNPCRMGPLTMQARRDGLAKVLSIQDRINSARGDMPEISLINDEERNRIIELIEANTWPNGWDGTEQLASVPFANVNRDGSIQPIFFELLK